MFKKTIGACRGCRDEYAITPKKEVFFP